eukprot:TRINITY_DN316_c0_g2_i2.p2 TRINITY_DN316_c0_g2~~TRINITY_DN316_c0_g2_i2.p2  ORF type:complete len:102 (+),score=2.41 TRINITY_DN316_c0_g2_i2:342-647(+)
MDYTDAYPLRADSNRDDTPPAISSVIQKATRKIAKQDVQNLEKYKTAYLHTLTIPKATDFQIRQEPHYKNTILYSSINDVVLAGNPPAAYDMTMAANRHLT